MTALRVVEKFDVIEHVAPSFFPVDVDLSLDPFALE
jgi:hypothetical protein